MGNSLLRSRAVMVMRVAARESEQVTIMARARLIPAARNMDTCVASP